jgi:hypothetical protein
VFIKFFTEPDQQIIFRLFNEIKPLRHFSSRPSLFRDLSENFC